MQGCKEEILKDIEVLPRKGNPGGLNITPGKGVETVITSDEGHIVAAAASLGQGRIFVITHAQYFVSFKEGEKNNESVDKLHQNVRKWVSNSKCRQTAGIRRLRHLKGEVQGKILLWHGGDIEDGMEEKVKKFVDEGGGLVHAICPWGWLSRQKPKTLKDMPLSGLLELVGIEHTTDMIHCNRNGFQVAQPDPDVPKCGEPEKNKPDEHEHEHDESHRRDDRQEQCKAEEQFEVQEQCEVQVQEMLEGRCEVPREWNDYDNLVNKWRNKILRGVDMVPKIGAPGRCVVYGKRSVSILSGCSPQNVCMAAASLGEGRVFSITHKGYITKREQPNLKKLLRNIFEWVTKRKYKNDDDILELKGKIPDFKDKKILMWLGDSFDCDESKIKAFVSNGGGLVHTVAPWGWVQCHKNMKLKDIPLTDLLASAGLFYTKDLCQCDAQFNVDVSPAACHNEAAQNIGYTLALGLKAEDLAKYGEYLCMGLASAPDNIKAELADNMKKMYDCHKATARNPSAKRPLTDPANQCLCILCDQLCNMGHDGMRCIPCVDDFPGQCPEGPTVCVEKEFTAKLTNFYSTGLYAAPGANIQVEVVSPKKTLNDSWVLRIGSHTDKIFKKDGWKRWPYLAKRCDLNKEQVKMFSPYGGLIYLENHRQFKIPHSITVKISGAVEAPCYDVTAPQSKKKWLACRNDPGPWADLHGRHISFTMPSSSIRHFDDLGPVLSLWDQVVETHCSLRGTDPAEHRHQWVVCDVQPSVGYMHAGYPIVTMMDVSNPKAPNKFLLDRESLLSDGRWGMFHELGHNMQRKWWTWNGTGEVTVNIFTLHAMDVISNKRPWIHEWLAKTLPKMKIVLQKDDLYEDWLKFPGVALGIYAQLQHCFGWEAYRKVFAYYESLEWDKQPQRDGDKITFWIETFSKTVGYNLCPLFEFWGFKLVENLSSRLQMPPFLPDDEMTQLAPHRVEVLEAVYPGLVRDPCTQACQQVQNCQ